MNVIERVTGRSFRLAMIGAGSNREAPLMLPPGTPPSGAPLFQDF